MPEDPEELEYGDDCAVSNVREVLHTLIGQTLLDITQSDWGEVDPTMGIDGYQRVNLHFSTGATLTFLIPPGCGFKFDGYTGPLETP